MSGMKYWPFLLTCPRDHDLLKLQHESIRKFQVPLEPYTLFYDPDEQHFDVEAEALHRKFGATLKTRRKGWVPWPEKAHVLATLDSYDQMCSDPRVADDDYVIHIDSDVIFLNNTIFFDDWGDVAGFEHSEPVKTGRFGDWVWMSGCFLAFRVGKLREAVAFAKAHGDGLTSEIQGTGLLFMHDVFGSYIMGCVGADRRPFIFSQHMETRLFREGCRVLDRAEGRRSIVHWVGLDPVWIKGKKYRKWEIPVGIWENGGIL